MGPLEKLAALKLWWWAQREMPSMLNRMLGNKITTALGVFIGAAVTLCASGVIPPQYCVYVVTANGIATALGLVAAKDATTGSGPGATS